MNLESLFMWTQAIGWMLLFALIMVLLMLGIFSLTDLLFKTKLLRRVEDFIFYYEKEEKN